MIRTRVRDGDQTANLKYYQERLAAQSCDIARVVGAWCLVCVIATAPCCFAALVSGPNAKEEVMTTRAARKMSNQYARVCAVLKHASTLLKDALGRIVLKTSLYEAVWSRKSTTFHRR